MRFDLSPEAILNEKFSRIYAGMRIFLYLSAILGAFFLAYLILFPSRYFFFSFAAAEAKNNNISNPWDARRAPVANGKVAGGENLNFDTAVSGIFSQAIINLSLQKKISAPESLAIEVRKSYAAFLYPEGSTIGFKDGSLLKNGSNFYVVSDGKLREFSSPAIAMALNFPMDAFHAVAADDLNANPAGQPIASGSEYPNFSTFNINGNYYVLQDARLKKFVSSAAFASQYDAAQAIPKNPDFLTAFPMAADLAGYADGSLISYGESIYIVSGENILPIDNPETFLSHGYDFNDVIPASADEIALYKRGKLFNITSTHPDGTIFKTTEAGEYYQILNSEKHRLSSQNIAASWLRHSPILVSKESLDITAGCDFKKNFWGTNAYSCEIPIMNMQQLTGNNYEFTLKPAAAVAVNSINIEFRKDINLINARSAVSGMLNRITATYVPATTTAQ